MAKQRQKGRSGGNAGTLRRELGTTQKELEAVKSQLYKVEALSHLNAVTIPRNLFNNYAIQQRSVATYSRDTEYAQRSEMYADTFVREMVKVIINRAIGTSMNDVRPFSILLKDGVVSDKFESIISDELKDLEKLIDEELNDVLLDAMFFGDGFSKIEMEQGKGVTDLLRNISVKPVNITPIISNKKREIAYEVGGLEGAVGKQETTMTQQSRTYVAPIHIARLNAKGNGFESVSSEQSINLSRLNLFNDNETIYEDGIYGGVMEGVFNDYCAFVWALKSVSNTRKASGILERFITQSLGSASDTDRKVLKKSLEARLKATINELKDKMNNNNPEPIIANHVIPTTGDNVNSINIQESNPNFQGLLTIEDIMLHIRKFCGSIGFAFDSSAFSQTIGGGEKDGLVQNSLQMDAQGVQIRKATRGYIKSIVKAHFLSKYDLDINDKYITIDFQSVLNSSKMIAEQQRMEAVSNTQQMFGILSEIKGFGFSDSEESRKHLASILKDALPQTMTDKEEALIFLVNEALKPPPAEEGM